VPQAPATNKAGASQRRRSSNNTKKHPIPDTPIRNFRSRSSAETAIKNQKQQARKSNKSQVNLMK
jgi:hypothetical protein